MQVRRGTVEKSTLEHTEGTVTARRTEGCSMALSVTLWNEFRHERQLDACREIYPDGIHAAIADYLERNTDFRLRLACLDEPEHGLTEQVLDDTDVLIWWGHVAQGEVSDEVADRVCTRVLAGMGLIVLHSALKSKVFLRLMGTTCDIKWRESGEKERLWVVAPGHPIAAGLGEYIEIENTEMYGEHFDIPVPDELVFISWFPGGEVFRSGCCFSRGNGRVFYFRPGHETHPIYHNEEVLRVILNAIKWAAPSGGPQFRRGNVPPLERI